MTTLAEDLLEMHTKTRRIRATFKNVGTIESEDLELLIEKALSSVTLSHIAESDWTKLKTLQVTSTLEIQDLIRQLEGE